MHRCRSTRRCTFVAERDQRVGRHNCMAHSTAQNCTAQKTATHRTAQNSQRSDRQNRTTRQPAPTPGPHASHTARATLCHPAPCLSSAFWPRPAISSTHDILSSSDLTRSAVGTDLGTYWTDETVHSKFQIHICSSSSHSCLVSVAHASRQNAKTKTKMLDGKR